MWRRVSKPLEWDKTCQTCVNLWSARGWGEGKQERGGAGRRSVVSGVVAISYSGYPDSKQLCGSHASAWNQGHNRLITSDLLTDASRVRHGFFTRQGGVSGEPYTSLNCSLGSGDERENVQENRARAMERLGLAGDALRTAFQVHSSRVVTVENVGIESDWPAEQRPQVDALVTRTPGIALGILTADCAPVLFADDEAGVIGAAHAGWRGARGGVVEATVAAMIALGACRSRIVAAVGPCIQRQSYEVGPEFRHLFIEDEPANGDLFEPAVRPGHHLFDLPAYVARRVAESAVVAIDVLPFDTCADPECFFSYRRTTLTGGGDYGRLLSSVALSR